MYPTVNVCLSDIHGQPRSYSCPGSSVTWFPVFSDLLLEFQGIEEECWPSVIVDLSCGMEGIHISYVKLQ